MKLKLNQETTSYPTIKTLRASVERKLLRFSVVELETTCVNQVASMTTRAQQGRRSKFACLGFAVLICVILTAPKAISTTNPSRIVQSNPILRLENDTTASFQIPGRNSSSVYPYFKVITATDRVEEGLACGGCTILFELADELMRAGFNVETLSLGRLERTDWDCNLTNNYTVVIFPEGPANSCKISPRITVRWLLAPIGSISGPEVTTAWHQFDWVYSYGIYAPGAAISVPDSNLLMILRNPAPGDIFRIVAHPSVTRSDKTCYSFRKRHLFHSEKSLMTLHDAAASALPEDIDGAVQHFLSHKFFVSYDPYTYLNFIASWLGCIPIVHPLRNMTKMEWILSGSFGPYVRETGGEGLMNIVAYGNTSEQVRLAQESLETSREELFKVKEWGKLTVQRFVRDVFVNITGQGNYESRLLVKDYFPTGWTAPRLWEL